jgi:CRISPR-associated protein Csm4
MPNLIPYHLTFHSGLRVGTHGVNLEETRVTIPSDTLFAALLDAWRRAGGDPEAFAAPFVDHPPRPPFLLTSAFPFVGQVRFFPMPVDLTRLFSKETFDKRGKQIKRIRFLSQALFKKALKGERLDSMLFPEDEYAEPEQGVALQGGALWLTAEKQEIERLPAEFRRPAGRRHALLRLKVWEMSRVPRVTVDRVNSASNIFHAGRTSFAKGCGLWFGVQWLEPDAPVSKDSDYRQAFKLTLSLLQDDGLGGERSTGYGAFTWEESGSVSLPDPAPGRPAWILSRYHPRPEELPAALAAEHSAYQLVSVGGWLRSPDGPAMRRKRLMMVAEGGQVALPQLPAGDVSDVRPIYDNPAGDLPHPVYRYGLALAAGMKEANHG